MVEASIIIPTYNRSQPLRETLNSLAQQSYPASQYEVIVVDDGGIDDTETVLAGRIDPFRLHYIRQPNQGSAAARNTGAGQAQGKIIIFLDDDMWVEPDYVAGLVEEHNHFPGVVAMGSELPYLPPEATPFAHLAANNNSRAGSDGEFVDFTACITNNLSIERADFFKIGQMQDVAGDGPTWWGDVDFGYRAKQAGLRFRRSGQAKCYHRDYSTQNLVTMSKRYHNSARLSVRLFHKFPEIQSHLPMFDDKTPIAWHQDSARLIVRKLARHVASAQPVLWSLEKIVRTVEGVHPFPGLLIPFYRWIIGGHIFRGYRAGLQEFGQNNGPHVLNSLND